MNKKGFTLIEVIVATGILSISVFGVYKLIGENTKIIERSNNSLASELLFPVLENCIENTGISDSKYFFLGSELKECNNSENNTYSTEIDGIGYTFYAVPQTIGTESITWDLKIDSELTGTSTGTYLQEK